MIDLVYKKKANGKLLLTSEYFVLDGAEALAVPTIFGQELEIWPNPDPFRWESKDEKGNTWFSTDNLSKSEDAAQNKLVEIFEYIGIERAENLIFQTFLDFPREWGLGSSSTLIALLADAFKINPYKFNRVIFKGSGYDIACAFQSTPILYSNQNLNEPKITSVEISANVKPYLYFVYLEQKQNSREGISHYRTLDIDKKSIIQHLNEITSQLIPSNHWKEWMEILDEHEKIISSSLNLPRLSHSLMKNCPYFIKSLGAWGGDFAMIISDEDSEKLKQYFYNQGYSTIFAYSELLK